MKNMFACYDAGATQQMKCSAYWMIVIGKLIDAEAKLNSLSHLIGKKRQIRDILIYMNNNATFDLDISMIAAENGISVRSLTALFMEILQMTPVQYLNQYRVTLACEKLQTSDMNISEVAEWSGYDDPLYFSRIFKKIKGVTPKDYRKVRIEEDPFLWMKEKSVFEYR